ncbi:MAG: phosphoribosylamine--glycine ligase [Gallionellales bacterium RIFCSPLOWO2_12_FULL_59_22]|nr:MAG: phosphoribosylamine--glycine ligase [Gallionellales bacterium RIFCSPLOWO2_02_FULL_59_110]OGT02689.1 MAG: phosphoribosylamine--glycine ligase [Gallionellales bacterium RIFCSPLOWO2_02_58_13]OGT11088.1 MAG: phosphoribosylamine--glycine ligase [Gallionellales bacterium RIFCSPLOWO2_12_FULL_59_22]
MKILVIGNGGREHALAWRLAQGAKVQKVYVAPGNAGTALEEGVENVALTAIPDLIEFVQRENIELTVVGPEAPLAAGVVDEFRKAGLKIFGPTRAAAQLESSKDFAKRFMTRHNIPTAFFETFSDIAAARAYVERHGAPIVIKADGLAAGKGVVVAMTKDEAFAAIDMMLADNKLGDAGARVVIEEFLEGEEASFIVMVDGKNVLAMATSQDHKRLLDNDAGPNTGGMGAYSPAPVVTPEIHARVLREVIQPVVRGMESEGITYTGFLYAGLMIDPQGGVKVLEFNCRMGDPETQPIMLRLKSDFAAIVEHAVNGTLDKVEAEWDRRTALGVVMAAANYPDAPRKDDIITGLPKKLQDAHVFHAGTAMQDGNKVVTSGGRVLCIVALGSMVKMAQKRAYEIADGIHFHGCQMRRDIGWRAIANRK